jgi:hypothetical protein
LHLPTAKLPKIDISSSPNNITLFQIVAADPYKETF